MVRHIIARHTADSDAFYEQGQTYPLAIKIGFFTGRVQIYKRRGYYDEMQEGSLRKFRNLEAFEQVFQVTEWKD